MAVVLSLKVLNQIDRRSALRNETTCGEVWTPERIARFWDVVANEPRLEQLYFSQHHAKSIVSIARLFGAPPGKVMDYGCGPGYLAHELVASGFHTVGIEHSEGSARLANARLDGLGHWQGCFTSDTIPQSLCKGGFDMVFSIEAYEHLLDEWVPAYFTGINEYLKPGGIAFVTTPNSENLDDNLVICPCCESKFHRWGHLRSVTTDSLRQVAESFGFEVLLCHGIDLAHARNLHVSVVDRITARLRLGGRTVRRVPSDMAPMVMALIRYIRKCETKPHLILIARKI
jgi:2-polyprenyl-3-methyl-5-hydroxy-6-metoxy-1,4-benzoquinol methylase